MSSAERDPVRWRDRTDQTDTAERRIGHAVRCLQAQRLRPPPSRARVLVRVRCAGCSEAVVQAAARHCIRYGTRHRIRSGHGGFGFRRSSHASVDLATLGAESEALARGSRGRCISASGASGAGPPPGPVASFPAFVVAEVGTGSAAPVMTAGNADGQRRGHKMAASASGSARIMTAWARHDRTIRSCHPLATSRARLRRHP